MAGACVILIAAVPTKAGESSCPDAISSFDTNGAVLSIPKGGAGRTLDILAIGSSSTEGIGASSAANAYPARLQDELAKDDGIAAEVKNAGIGGELAAKTLQRLKSALKSGWARLVIWQVGTNDAIVGVDEALFRATVRSGVEAARLAGVPLVLVGPQVTLIPTDPARYERFVAIVDEIGASAHVPVLDRYVMMKRWGVKNTMALGLLLSHDGLHMNDLGYQCLAHALAEAIEGAAAGAKL
ncbi:MAG: SGNH/GDSL hydrolase family protein [Hyphomicrobiales bacterium]|nr:SGNH/GDSL hydrolase family protein [Hyphomicrobiales bacterium]